MRFAKESIPEGVDLNGLTVAFMQWPKGLDADALLDGLPGGLCPCPHWGYALKGCMLVKYPGGKTEQIKAGDAYYIPAGHSALIEFQEVMAHVARKMQQAT